MMPNDPPMYPSDLLPDGRLSFDQARQLVASQLLPQFPRSLGEPVVRDTGEESSRYFRVHVDLADGDPLMDPPVILVEKVTGHISVMEWHLGIGGRNGWTDADVSPVSVP